MARYFLRYRHSDTGLTPTFLFFKKSSDLSDVGPPAIVEVVAPPGGGTYYFDFIPTFDIIFEVDGGASIPTEEVRYISDTIGPKDAYVDEPLSQVKDDVWDDTVNRTGGTKGEFVETIGVPADTSAQATLFGKTLLYKESIRGDTAGTSDGNDVEQVFDSVGGAAADLSDIKGAGFATGTDSLKVISDNVDAINVETDAASIANAVWNETLAGHVTAGSSGVALKNSLKILKNRTKIDVTLDTLTVYDDDGTTVLYVFNLKDSAGAPSGETPFERVP